MKRILLTMLVGTIVSIGSISLAFASNLNNPGSICKPALSSVNLSYDFGTSVRNSTSSFQQVICPLVRQFNSNYPQVILGAIGANCTLVSKSGLFGFFPPYQVIAGFPTGVLVPIYAPQDAVLALSCSLAPFTGNIFGIGVFP